MSRCTSTAAYVSGREWVLSVAVALAGCQSTATKEATPSTPPPAGDSTAGDPPVEPAPTPSALSLQEWRAQYAIAIARQEERLRRLRFIDSRGSAVIHYSDADGKHFEQGSLRLHAVLPFKTSIQISKDPKKLAHIGSDGDVWWFFRLDRSPTTLEVWPWNQGASAGPSVMAPRDILVLCGLSPLPPVDEVTLRMEGATLMVEPAPSATLVDAAPSQRVRFALDATTWLPTRVELLDQAGIVTATSELTDYQSAPADGIAVGDYPRLPLRIVIVRPNSEDSIRFTLDQPTARAAGINPKLFELSELQASMKPDEVFWREGPSDG